ncbi:MAG: complex I NDUFA9 subunit family protein [Alphaproteobacteria bacterium]|nr:complex I NDUFA9 subunit family protein [Alphaproteobacteria bacterium]
MAQHSRIITIVGGSGFVGRYVVQQLAHAGYRVQVICRNPNAALALKTAGDPGQVVLTAGNIARPEALSGKLAGSYAVVNLVGVLFENGAQNFAALHAKSAEALAKLAKSAGAARFIHLSALGVDKAFGSEYARTKLVGEKAVTAAFTGATILRPSVIFGPEDHFFNQFAAMPALPLIGGGKTRFQPVYVGDVAKAVLACLEQPESAGQLYELGGAKTYSFKALMDFVQEVLRVKKPMVKLPFGLAMLVAFFAETAYKLIPLIRRPLLTRDQVRLLKYDNVVSADANTLTDLGVTPQPLETIVPRYLARFNPKKGW